MAEAITADIVEGQKELIKKVTLIGNILNKNLVPASQQKERDAEAAAWKGKLFGFLSGIKDSLFDILENSKVAKAGKFSFLAVLGGIAFLIAFFKEIGLQLAKLQKILVPIRALGGLIIGVITPIFTAIKEALIITKEALIARIATAYAAFKESKIVKTIGSAFIRLRNLLNLAKLNVIGYFKTAFAAFKEHSFVKAIGGAFVSMRNWLNLGKLHVVGLIKDAYLAFKEHSVVKAIGGAFSSLRSWLSIAKFHVIGLIQDAYFAFKENAVVKAIGGAFTSMRNWLNLGKLHLVGLFQTAFAAFKENAVVKAIGGAFKTMAGMFGGAVGIAETGGVAKSGGILGSLRVAMAAFKESPIFKAFATIGKVLSGAFAGVLSLIGGAAKAATGPIAGMGAKVGTGIVGAVTKVTGAMGTMVKAISNFPGIKGILSFAKGMGTFMGKLLWPVTLIIGLFDFVTGWKKPKNWEGEDPSVFDKMGMGLEAALIGIIGLPLDLVMKGIKWIMDKLGLGTKTVIDEVTGEAIVEKSEWRKAFDAFSFSDLISKLWQGLWGGIDAGITWIKELFTNPGAAIAAVWKGATNIGQWLYDNTIKGMVDWVKDLFDIDWAALGWSLLPAPLEKLFKGQERKEEITDKLAALEEASGINQRDIDRKNAAITQKQSDIDRSMAGENVYDWMVESVGRQNDRLAISGMSGSVENTQETLDSQLSEMEALRAELATLNKQAGEEGSLYTHDVHLQKLLQPLPIQMGALLKAFGSPSGGGGSGTNVTVVAPATSTTTAISNTSETIYSASDPYVGVAGAYG